MNGKPDCLAASNGRVTGPFGNIFVRQMEIMKKGEVVQGHTHNFDHVTHVFRGSVHLRAWDSANVDQAGNPLSVVEKDFAANSYITIRKNWVHEFTALEDGTQADCIYALRDFDGEVTDSFNGDLTPYT